MVPQLEVGLIGGIKLKVIGAHNVPPQNYFLLQILVHIFGHFVHEILYQVTHGFLSF